MTGDFMGQHKHNPTAIKAKNGELPPKPQKKSKAECDRELYKLCLDYLDSTIIGAFRSETGAYGKFKK